MNCGINKSNSGFFTLTKSVALIGMMGAGKTSIGQALAGLLSVSYTDSDAEIEKASRQTVQNIFANYGEKEFRRIERQVISRLLLEGPRLLSLGGGAFMDEQTRAHLKQNAVTVWLNVDEALLVKRLLKHKGRPLLQGDNVEEKIHKIFTERAPIYALADVVVSCDDGPVLENAEKVRAALQARPELQTE